MEVTFDEWKKLKMKVGKVLSVERIPKTEKLYKMQVGIGERDPMQMVASLVPYYTEDELRDKKVIVLVNLKPTKFAGEVSEGMLLCAEKDDGSECVLLTVEKGIAEGTPVT